MKLAPARLPAAASAPPAAAPIARRRPCRPMARPSSPGTMTAAMVRKSISAAGMARPGPKLAMARLLAAASAARRGHPPAHHWSSPPTARPSSPGKRARALIMRSTSGAGTARPGSRWAARLPAVASATTMPVLMRRRWSWTPVAHPSSPGMMPATATGRSTCGAGTAHRGSRWATTRPPAAASATTAAARACRR